MKAEEIYQEIYHHDPEGIAFSPYRICPIGAHWSYVKKKYKLNMPF